MWSAWFATAAIGTAHASWIKPCETWTLMGVEGRKASTWDFSRGDDPPDEYPPLHVTPCTMLRFTYGNGQGDVWLMPNKDAYDNCDFSGATEVGDGMAGGGGGEHSIGVITDEPAFQFEITQAHVGSTLYFSDRRPCDTKTWGTYADKQDCQNGTYADERKLTDSQHCNKGQKLTVHVESSENIPLDQVSIASTAANIENALDELEDSVHTLAKAIHTGLTFNGTARPFEMLALLRTFEVESHSFLRTVYACFEGGEYFESSRDGLTRSYSCDQEPWYQTALQKPSTFMNASLIAARDGEDATISVTQLAYDSNEIIIGVVGAAANADLVNNVLRDELAVINDFDRVMYVVKDVSNVGSELITTCQGWVENGFGDPGFGPSFGAQPTCRRWEQLAGDDTHTCQERGKNMSLKLASDGLTGVRAEECQTDVAAIAQELAGQAANRTEFLRDHRWIARKAIVHHGTQFGTLVMSHAARCADGYTEDTTTWQCERCPGKTTSIAARHNAFS